MKIKLMLLTIFLMSFAGMTCAQTKIAPKITAIRARLFHDALGTFSEDILETEDNFLFNTIIGEGAADGKASTSTLVTVEVSGQNFPVGTLKVQITATGDKNRVIQKRLISAELYDNRTKFFAPLWLYDTGCEQINITAKLLGKGASAATVKKKIPFRCGE